MIGKTLEHYKIVKQLGKGGMGEVYLAQDGRLGRKVALKTLPPEMAADPDRRARFEREAKVVAALNHPNIVTIHSVEDSEGLSFITMEHVEGQLLSDLIPKGGLPLSRLYDLAVPLADALAAAHAKGITHRDLKPANVMVTREGRVKVLDFGLAKLADVAESGPETGAELPTATAPMTVEGRILGTVAYMSPEQAEGKPVDARSDVFSLGILLYEMATGQRPFGGDTTVSTITSILRDTPREIGELNPSLPRHLGRIVQRCLAKEPGRRYPTALDIRNELEALRGETDSATDQPNPVVVSARRPGRKRALFAGLAVVAILAVVAAGAIWLRPGSAGPTTVAAARLDSIAVLPFANMSGDPDNEYFSDGLAEELLNVLARLQGLRVAARTSSFHFKGYTGDIAEVGEQLKVATILQGSVRRAGERVRVTAQLINAADGFHLWSETYDRTLDDVFAIQEDIATRVVGALQVTLLGEEATRLAKRPTENLEAYDAYLLGQQRMARRGYDSLAEAAQYFQKAIDLDPDYALAYIGLADANLLLIDGQNFQPENAIAQARPLIDRAFELDGQLGEAYASLGMLERWAGDQAAAEKAFRRAIELNPGYANVYMWYGQLVGDTDPARQMELFQEALALDPLSPVVNYNLARALAKARRFDESLDRYRRVIEIDREVALGYSGLAELYIDRLDQPEEAVLWLERGSEVAPDDLKWELSPVYLRLGRLDDAIALWRRTIDRDPDDAMNYLGLASCYSYFGRSDEAIQILRRRIDTDPESWQPYVSLAQLHVHLGQVDEAIRLCHEASARHLPAFALDWLSRFYLLLDDEPSAARAWERVKEAWPGRELRDHEARILLRHLKFVEAEALVRELGEENPGEWSKTLAFLDMKAGRHESAQERYAKLSPRLFHDDDPVVNTRNLEDAITSAAILLKTGHRERAEMLLRKSEAFVASQDGEVRRATYRIEPVYLAALRGRKAEALDAFRLAIDHGWRDDCIELEQNPALESLVGDPRFEAMLAEVRADLARQRQRLAADGLATPL